MFPEVYCSEAPTLFIEWKAKVNLGCAVAFFWFELQVQWLR